MLFFSSLQFYPQFFLQTVLLSLSLSLCLSLSLWLDVLHPRGLGGGPVELHAPIGDDEDRDSSAASELASPAPPLPPPPLPPLLATASSSAGLLIPLCSQSTRGLAAMTSSALGGPRACGSSRGRRRVRQTRERREPAQRGLAPPGKLPSSGRTGKGMTSTPSLLRNSVT